MYVDLKNINYCYIAYYDDEFQFIEYVFDTQRELAQYLGINDSVITIKRSGRFTNRKGTLIYEKLKINDYCFVIFENDLNNIVFATRDFEDIVEMFKESKEKIRYLISRCFNNKQIYSKKKFGKFINKKYQLATIDLFDLDSYSFEKITNIIENSIKEVKNLSNQ